MAGSSECLDPFLNGQTCLPSAAIGGHLEILQWARSQGCAWNEQTYAARGGHLELLLQWARSQGCPWDEQTCANAARGGHLELLQWLRGEGCPWNEQACAKAAEGGHLCWKLISALPHLNESLNYAFALFF